MKIEDKPEVSACEYKYSIRGSPLLKCFNIMKYFNISCRLNPSSPSPRLNSKFKSVKFTFR